MTSIELTENIKASYLCGQAAFASGIKAPVLDRAFVVLTVTARDAGLIGTEVGASLPLLSAWSAGWHGANASAKVEG